MTVDASTLVGGEMQYALGTDATTAPTEGWGTDIPNGTNAGTYYVWYKAVGDATHADSEAKCVTVTIAEKSETAATYAATGSAYAWTKGSKDGLAITFKRSDEGDADTTFSHFVSASVDGKAIKEGDDYTKAKGSVVVTLTPSYLNTLSAGEHALTATFDDGSATAEFTVTDEGKPGPAPQPEPTPTPTPTPAATHSITFDANGGTGTMDKLAVEAGKSVALTANAFKRDGYAFSGWNTAKDGSGTAYADKATVTPTADLTLYAQWKKASSSSQQSSKAATTTSKTSTAKSSLPSTGDPSAPAAAAALALAGAGLAAAGPLRRRRR